MTIKPIVKLLIVSGLSTAVIAAHHTPGDKKKVKPCKSYTQFEKRIMGSEFYATPTQFGRFKVAGYADIFANHQKNETTNASAYQMGLRSLNVMLDGKIGEDWGGRLSLDFNDNAYNQGYIYYANPTKSPIYFKAGRHLIDLGQYQGQWAADITSPNYTLNNLFSVLKADGVMTFGASSASGFYGNIYTFKADHPKVFLSENYASNSDANGALISGGLSTQGQLEIQPSNEKLNYGTKVGFAGKQSGVGYDINMSVMNDTSFFYQPSIVPSIVSSNVAVTLDGDAASATNPAMRGPNSANDPVQKKAIGTFHVGGNMKGFHAGFDLAMPGSIMSNVNVKGGSGILTAANGDAFTAFKLAGLNAAASDYPDSQQNVNTYAAPADADAVTALEIKKENIQSVGGINQLANSDNIKTYMPKIWTLEAGYSFSQYGGEHMVFGRYGATTKKDDQVSQLAIKNAFTIGYAYGFNKHVTVYTNYTKQTGLKQTVDLKTNAKTYDAPSSVAAGDWNADAAGGLGGAVATGKSTVTRSSGNDNKIFQLGVRFSL
ncbi:hypothetical protein N9Y17_03325 [Gammaproteobacteria bacterium]|nr:hypothetical protein [Gammaproteobacteria bacterium]